MIVCKRIYDPPSPRDGHRVLIDRLWPRGLTKEKAHITEWLKDVAPSHELRRWLASHPDEWAEFEHRYRAELAAPELQEQLAHLRAIAKSKTLTLLFAKRNEEHNNAVVLKNVLENGA